MASAALPGQAMVRRLEDVWLWAVPLPHSLRCEGAGWGKRRAVEPSNHERRLPVTEQFNVHHPILKRMYSLDGDVQERTGIYDD